MTVIAGLPSLDVYTLSETWALGEALHALWARIGASLGLPPSRWLDDDGRRIYAAVMALSTETDLDYPVAEDAQITADTRMVAVRKPHAIGETVFSADGRPVMTVRLLTSLVRRDTAGSNKKLSKVRTLWQAPDLDAAAVDGWLAQHHAMKDQRLAEAAPVLRHEANRLADFNAADLFYFRNFVHLARAAEWKEARGTANPPMAARRDVFFYGNLDDGDEMVARVARDGDTCRTELARADGGFLCLSVSRTQPVTMQVR
jgi:probable biosynthetic protein (TIGR04098 family)